MYWPEGCASDNMLSGGGREVHPYGIRMGECPVGRAGVDDWRH